MSLFLVLHTMGHRSAYEFIMNGQLAANWWMYVLFPVICHHAQMWAISSNFQGTRQPDFYKKSPVFKVLKIIF
jgi:hypothetical protein